MMRSSIVYVGVTFFAIFVELKLTHYSIDSGPEQYKDAPICVQIVGYRHKDEALIKAAAILDSIINKI